MHDRGSLGWQNNPVGPASRPFHRMCVRLPGCGVYDAERLQDAADGEVGLWTGGWALERSNAEVYRGVRPVRTLWHLHCRLHFRPKPGPSCRHADRLHLARRLRQGRLSYQPVLASNLWPAYPHLHPNRTGADLRDTIRQSQVPHALRPAPTGPQIHPPSLQNLGFPSDRAENLQLYQDDISG